MFLEREKYPLIASGAKHPTFQEYLEIIQFESQDGLNFLATVYDSIELWQDPQIIDIFSLD
jgi:hypothetical protein